jgi:protein-disulfide isomerase
MADRHSQLKVAVGPQDHAQGDASAPVTLVEYGDYQCPYCGAAYPVVKSVQERLGKRLRFVFRNFPLAEVHPHAVAAAEVAEAAGEQEKFWEMHDILFENQQALTTRDLTAYIRDLDLDVGKIQAAIDGGAVAKRVQSDFDGGVRSGVNGTPTFFVNGVPYDGDWRDGESFAADLLEAAQG